MTRISQLLEYAIKDRSELLRHIILLEADRHSERLRTIEPARIKDMVRRISPPPPANVPTNDEEPSEPNYSPLPPRSPANSVPTTITLSDTPRSPTNSVPTTINLSDSFWDIWEQTVSPSTIPSTVDLVSTSSSSMNPVENVDPDVENADQAATSGSTMSYTPDPSNILPRPSTSADPPAQPTPSTSKNPPKPIVKRGKTTVNLTIPLQRLTQEQIDAHSPPTQTPRPPENTNAQTVDLPSSFLQYLAASTVTMSDTISENVIEQLRPEIKEAAKEAVKSEVAPLLPLLKTIIAYFSPSPPTTESPGRQSAPNPAEKGPRPSTSSATPHETNPTPSATPPVPTKANLTPSATPLEPTEQNPAPLATPPALTVTSPTSSAIPLEPTEKSPTPLATPPAPPKPKTKPSPAELLADFVNMDVKMAESDIKFLKTDRIGLLQFANRTFGRLTPKSERTLRSNAECYRVAASKAHNTLKSLSKPTLRQYLDSYKQAYDYEMAEAKSDVYAAMLRHFNTKKDIHWPAIERYCLGLRRIPTRDDLYTILKDNPERMYPGSPSLALLPVLHLKEIFPRYQDAISSPHQSLPLDQVRAAMNKRPSDNHQDTTQPPEKKKKRALTPPDADKPLTVPRTPPAAQTTRSVRKPPQATPTAPTATQAAPPVPRPTQAAPTAPRPVQASTAAATPTAFRGRFGKQTRSFSRPQPPRPASPAPPRCHQGRPPPLFPHPLPRQGPTPPAYPPRSTSPLPSHYPDHNPRQLYHHPVSSYTYPPQPAEPGWHGQPSVYPHTSYAPSDRPVIPMFDQQLPPSHQPHQQPQDFAPPPHPSAAHYPSYFY